MSEETIARHSAEGLHTNLRRENIPTDQIYVIRHTEHRAQTSFVEATNTIEVVDPTIAVGPQQQEKGVRFTKETTETEHMLELHPSIDNQQGSLLIQRLVAPTTSYGWVPFHLSTQRGGANRGVGGGENTHTPLQRRKKRSISLFPVRLSTCP